MNERTMKLRLGAAVVLSLVIIMIFLTFLGSREKLSTTSYEIKIQMMDAPNVMANTPIYQSGILIGRVSKVELTETKGVIVTARIYDDHKLYHDQECHLVSSLLGDASLRMITRQTDETDETRHTEIKPGEIIQGVTTLDPALLMAQMQEKLTVTINDVTTASVELSRVAATTNEILLENRENVAAIMSNAQSITGNTDRIMTNFSMILNDEFCRNIQSSVANIYSASEKLPETMDKMNDTLDGIQKTVQFSNTTLTGLSERLGKSLDSVDNMIKMTNKTLTNVHRITEVLANEDQMASWTASITETLREMSVFTASLNREDSTLGMLLRDRRLYDRLQNTLDKVSELPQRLEPILFNAQVMSEKLAQHPELLGLSGYLKPNSGTSGTIPWPKGVRPSMSSYAPSSWNSAPYSTPTQYQMPVAASGNWRTSGGAVSGMSPESETVQHYETAPLPYSAPSVSPVQEIPVEPVPVEEVPVIPPTVQRSGSPAFETVPNLKNAESTLVLKSAETGWAQQEAVPAAGAVAGGTDGVTDLSAAGADTAAVRQIPENVRIPKDARSITPDMVGMTEEEFRNADPALLSEAIWDAVAVSEKGTETMPALTADAAQNVTEAQGTHEAQGRQVAQIEQAEQNEQAEQKAGDTGVGAPGVGDPAYGDSLAELSISGLPSPEPLPAPVSPASGNRPSAE